MKTSHIAVIAILATANFLFVFAIERFIARHATRPIYAMPLPDGQHARELHNALVTTPVHALILAGFLLTGLLRPGRESALSFLVTFAVTFVWTEIWHYASHVAMHTRRLHFIHREHHRSRITNPWSSVSFSVLEKFIFSAGIIGFMSALSYVMEVSVYGLAAYYVMYFFLNTLGHANIEIRKPGYSRSWLARVFNTPAYHAMHHARYVKNYGLVTPLLDKLFHTHWEDAGRVQDRAARGMALRSLNEKC